MRSRVLHGYLNKFARTMCLAQLLLTYDWVSTGGTGMINQTGIFKLLVAPAPALSASIVPHTSIAPMLEHGVTNGNKGPVKIESDREVIRCITCGMVQYLT